MLLKNPARRFGWATISICPWLVATWTKVCSPPHSGHGFGIGCCVCLPTCSPFTYLTIFVVFVGLLRRVLYIHKACMLLIVDIWKRPSQSVTPYYTTWYIDTLSPHIQGMMLGFLIVIRRVAFPRFLCCLTM